MSIRLLHGDCLIELPKLAAAGERFHAVVTDPPYGLEFMGREWDGADGFRRSLNEADAGRDSVHGRTKADRADSKHPTVKPVDLIRWLVTLACPPGGHVLDCFAGSGTAGEACMLAGFDCTLIEREAQHARDIEHRIKRWSGLDAPLFADAP